jgi:hypothetical protein
MFWRYALKVTMKSFFVIVSAVVLASAAAYAGLGDGKRPVEFFAEHTHHA